MIIEKKKIDKRNRKKEKILEAAAILFSRKSYHEVMVEDVAKHASIAKGTVYNYFDSKEEIYFSIMKNRMENLTVLLKKKIKTEMSSIKSLHSFIIYLYMFMMKYQNFFMMYQKESLKADNELCSELIKLENELKELLKGIINSGKAGSLFRNIEEGFAADLILGSIYGAIYRGIENNFNEEQMINDREKIFDFIFHGLFSGFESGNMLPLINKTIVITRTIEQSKESAEAFRKLGANLIIFPTLDIVPPDSWQQFDNIVTGKAKIDFIIFTSVHAVKMFIKRCNELGVSFNYSRMKIVAVGNKTASVCEENEIPIHIIPKKFSGEGVINSLLDYDLEGKVIFIPRSAIGREELPEGLMKLGAIIKTALVYNVSIPAKEKIRDNLELLLNSKPDLFIFTSPSTFENFLKILDIKNPIEYFKDYDVAAIGPTTKSTIEMKKVKVNIMPSEYTIDGLAKTIVGYYKK